MMRTLFALLLTLAMAPRSPCCASHKGAPADDLLRKQILLDKDNFGPGVIDGKEGEFTKKAAGMWARARHLDPNDAAAHLTLPSEIPTTTDYKITEEDFQHVGTVPESLAAEAKQKSLPYPNIIALVAERYHTSPACLKSLNKDMNLERLKAGDTVKVPNVKPFEIESFSAQKELQRKHHLASRVIKIQTQEKLLNVMDGENIIASFPITPGSERLPAPKGTWKIVSITTLPNFRWDPKMLQKGERSSHYHILPPGPSNPVGIVWMELNHPGIGIHGTNEPDTIGRSSSHGCIRLANWDAAKLIDMVTAGCTVEIE
jgi:lipoprotein-anchoring transpeptidase ErfK/SrfK